MKYFIEYRQEVETDLQEIIDWYKEDRIGLEKEFLINFQEAINRIAENPFLYQVRIENTNLRMLTDFYTELFSKSSVIGLLSLVLFILKKNPRLIRK